MPSRFTLPHIDIAPFATSQPYLGEGSPGNSAPRIREEHGRRLLNELQVAYAQAYLQRPADDRLPAPEGVLLEVELRRGTKPDILEGRRERIRAGATKVNDAGYRTVALYVPDHARPVLETILNDYLHGDLTPKGGNPPNRAKVEAVEAIRMARLETVWTDDPAALPSDAQHQMWWAIWCLRDREAQIDDVCARLDVRSASRDQRLYFPETAVVPVLATRAAIELMLFATGAIAELRRADDNPVFFTDEVRGDQHPWTDDLAERVVWPGSDAPAVCIFDTGVNRAHSLIEPALRPSDLHAIDERWEKSDHDRYGHGTAMAGMALHGDLTPALGDASERMLAHRLESVKLLPPAGFDPNEPHSYGALTQAAVALPEIEDPERVRVYCMAVTNRDVTGATASTWSAAIDQAAAGVMPGDDVSAPKRLFILAAGNTPPEMMVADIQPQDNHPIEDPAQAWNALTVGGCTDRIDVRDRGYEDWTPMAEAGELSPHSRTSTNWPQGRSPYKPDIVIEAGNRGVNPAGTEAANFDSLSLLTTGHDVARAPLVPFQATSAAAAQAARMAARLIADHPDYWPETIRALMVHSAEWTAPMLAAFDATPGRRDCYGLVRRYGYGVPDFERATACARNHVALVAQKEIQPYRMQGTRKFNECHYYRLPIPPRVLEELGNEPLQLKITLSYFIEPNPGLSANVDPQRYQSFGLRFDLRRSRETVDQFKLRVNASDREGGVAPPTHPDDQRWTLGPQSVSAGSLHCDIWNGPAIELLRRDMLCIKPVNGWWRQRAARETVNKRTRYALVVTLKARNVDIDLYTPISTAITVPAIIATETEI